MLLGFESCLDEILGGVARFSVTIRVENDDSNALHGISCGNLTISASQRPCQKGETNVVTTAMSRGDRRGMVTRKVAVD